VVNYHVVLDLARRVNNAPHGAMVTVPLDAGSEPGLQRIIADWCDHTGNELVRIEDMLATVRRGRSDPLGGLAAGQLPGSRVWIYTNFDCNLACDYCCVRSSPQTPRRALDSGQIRQLAAEAVEAGVGELVLTGGEPFLLPDIAELVEICTDALPTTLLTNGMLFKGRRLESLRRMNRDRLALQISLDSVTPDLHDRHRGRGSWDRALAGVRIAIAEGFRVRIAATLMPEHVETLAQFHDFLDTLGIASEDHLIRPLAHQGVADHGIVLTVESLIPEVTVTADGIYWHPVSAVDDDHLVTRDIFPLASAISQVRSTFRQQRAHAAAAAQWFPCA